GAGGHVGLVAGEGRLGGDVQGAADAYSYELHVAADRGGGDVRAVPGWGPGRRRVVGRGLLARGGQWGGTPAAVPGALKRYPVQGSSSATRSPTRERWAQPGLPLTTPMACMSAYMVVGPTKLKPRAFRPLASA